MVAHCPACGKEVEAGDVKCPACGAVLPEPGDPSAPQKAAVLAATFLPVIGVVLFLVVAGAIVVGGLMLARRMSRNHHALSVMPLAPTAIQPLTGPVEAPPPVSVPSVPVVTPVAPVVVNPEVPTAPPAVVVVPAPPVAVFAPPSLTGFTPAIVPPGQQLTLQGDSLGRVLTVVLFDSRGAFRAVAPIVSKTEKEVVVTVPEVRFADHGIYPAVMSGNGMAVLAEEHLGNTPWGTDGHLNRTAVNVRTGDEIVVLDHMLVFAMPETTVSMGDNCVGFFSNDVTLKAVGRNCTVYYVEPLQKPANVSNCRFIRKPSMELDVAGDAFRVKAALPDADNN